MPADPIDVLFVVLPHRRQGFNSGQMGAHGGPYFGLRPHVAQAKGFGLAAPTQVLVGQPKRLGRTGKIEQEG
jgi:hypothetical protein